MYNQKHYDYVVVNDDLSKAFRKLKAIVVRELSH